MPEVLRKGVFLDLETVDNGDLDRSRLSSCLVDWDWFEFSEPQQIVGRIRTADVVISNKCVLDRTALESAGKLKLIALAATGTDNVDLEAASELGITVCNIRDYASNSVAQHAITLMLNLLTAQPWYWQSVRQGAWSNSRQFCLNDRPIREFKGLNFGVIGYGVLGKATAELAETMGMKVLIAERKGCAARKGRVSFAEIIRQADVLSIHCPLTGDTRGLINRDVMRAMKPSALLVNTARGEIINEKHLAEALREGVIGGAGVDTLSQEPPPWDHPLLASNIPNLIVTPHNAWASRTARQSAVDQLVELIGAFANGKVLNQVN
ncbi:MAG: D-2-hydroxyacid dehydrogenase [Xanthomonadales bacterium]